MIEKTVLDYLTEKLSVSCYMERPETAPASFCVIEKTADNRKDMLRTATIAVQSYAATLYGAATLSSSVVDNMLAMPETVSAVYGVELNSEYIFTDTASKRYRYQAVFHISY